MSRRPRARTDDAAIDPLLLGAGAAVVVGAATVAVSWLTSAGLLLATLAVVGAVAVLAQRLAQSQKQLHWETRVLGVDARRGADSRVDTLRHQIELAAGGQPAAQERVHALLTELAAERLRDQRGLEPTDAEAVSLLGPDLTAYLRGRPASPSARLTTDQLTRHVQKLEELS